MLLQLGRAALLQLGRAALGAPLLHAATHHRCNVLLRSWVVLRRLLHHEVGRGVLTAALQHAAAATALESWADQLLLHQLRLLMLLQPLLERSHA